MTIDNIIGISAEFEGSTREAAVQKIRDFVEINEIPELNNSQRILENNDISINRNQFKHLHALHQMMPSILDRAFPGEL